MRAGYGIYYNAPAVNNVVNGPQQSNAPYVSAQTLTSSYAVPLTLADPYPLAAATSGTLTLYGIDRNLPDAQIQQWSFSVQQQLSDSLALDLAYLGSKGTHLPLFYNTNQPPPQTGSVAQQQASRRFPQYGNIYFQDDVGNSSYNGLTAKLDKRYKNGLSFVVSYALGKSIDDTPGTLFNVSPSRSIAENPLNFRMDRGLSGFDIRNRFVFSPVYDLPFGRGKMFVNGGGLMSALIGGWEISGILTLQSGPPFTALVNSYRSQSLAQVDRPNVIGNGNNGAQTVSQWFNTSAFALSPLGTYGNEGRNNLTGPPLKNLDIVLSRNFRIKERVGLQFRAEAFNIANHPNFGLPDQTFEDPSFGALTSTSTDPRELQVALKIKF